MSIRPEIRPVPGLLVGSKNNRSGASDFLAALRGQRPRTLREYQDLLHERQVATPAEAADELGPIMSPTVNAGLTQEQLLEGIYNLMRMLPSDIWMQGRTQLPLTPRECVPIFVGARAVSATASASTEIISYTVPEGYTGFLTHLALGCNPEASLGSISWRMKINGNVHPNFSNVVLPANTYNSPYPCTVELSRAKKVSIEAVNAAAVAIPCSAVLLGFQEIITSEKPYGSTSSNGVA